MKGYSMFTLNEKVVYPGHGVAKVNRLVKKIIAGQATNLIELTFLNKEMTILIPTSSASSAGIRKISSDGIVDTVLKMLAEPTHIAQQEFNGSSWSKRHRDYQNKLHSGDLSEIGQIYRDLNVMSMRKELSFGEKNLLNQTEQLLAEEIAIVKKTGEEKTVEHLRSLCQYSKPSIVMAVQSI